MANAPMFIQRGYRNDPRRMMAQMLMRQATDTSPIQHWTQGAARLGQALAANVQMDRADKADTARANAHASALAQALASPDPAQAVATSGNADLIGMLAPGMIEQRMKPQTPIIKDFVEGGETVSKQWHPNTGMWEVVGRGPRWQENNKAPTIRDFVEGGQTVSKQWNPDTRAWEVMGRGPRWQQPQPAKPTMAQNANNQEITSARDRVMAAVQRHIQPGESPRDVIQRLTAKATDTGRENPYYDQWLATDFRTATQRMVGGDKAYEEFLRGLETAAPNPEQKGNPQPNPEVEEAEDSLFNSVTKMLGFGDDGGAKADLPPAPNRPKPEGLDDAAILDQARQAILGGAPKANVEQRLRAWGVDPKGL